VELPPSFDQVAGLLKFNREEERGGHVDSLHFRAGSVAATRSNLAGPEIQSGLIRLTIEKIVIVLSHEDRGVVDSIPGRFGYFIIDGQRRS